MHLCLCCVVCLLVGILFGYISSDKIYFNKFLNLINNVINGIISRIDKALTGNDGIYSHTRINNIVWGIGGFCLVCVAVIREIKISDSILVLMGSAMGISGLQTVFNKLNELKFTSNQSSDK